MWRAAALLLVLSSAAAGACGGGGARLSCASSGLGALPDLSRALRSLDVSNNNISVLSRDALQPAVSLRELNLSANPLRTVEEGALDSPTLARLWLDGCQLRHLPPLRTPRLQTLSLADNELEEVSALPESLRVLRLPRNLLRGAPAGLRAAARLQALDLSGNLLKALEDDALPPLPDLHTLVLRRNRIQHIGENAFQNTPALRVLRLEENLLDEIPTALGALPQLEHLSLAHNRVQRCGADVLQRCGRLADLELSGNPLAALQPDALDGLAALEALSLAECRGLRALPALRGARRLRRLRADHSALRALPEDLCRRAPLLREIDLSGNELERVPELEQCAELRVLSLSWNRVSALELRGLRALTDLQVAHNRLHRLTREDFRDTPNLRLLDLEDNHITHIDIEAFLPIESLEDLNVGENRFSHLPAGGLQRVRHLKVHNNPHLTRFPPPELLPRLQTLVAAYAYHCCEFMAPEEGGVGPAPPPPSDDDDDEDGALSDVVLVPARADLAAWANGSDLLAQYRALLQAAEPAPQNASARRPAPAVRCVPRPGPFLPCVDLFDWWTLRCGVWAVFLLALLGNGTVVFVLVFSRSRMDVPRFLVSNLAAADFFMGLYLGFLAVVDAGTLGEFRAHALTWQMSAGCQLAGFLGVLSSELSVYTLAVITLERNYAITHAMHLNKRLSLRHAAAVMAGGWGFALTAAALPLFGVSDYRKFAVCLPFETDTPTALGYVVALLAVNGVAFLVLLGCYLKMYCAIRGSQAWNSNDSRIAKRMALLVFTDFICWSPIALFALTAAFGVRLVSLEQAKVFTVFVLPLNSCCNPFLYAILTKQFKKDCTLVCKAIEESRVTRGIGRCRHSSNFSNRQTPANTNSLAERSSRGGHAPACACRRLLEERAAPPAHGERLLRWLRGVRPARAPRPPAPPPKRAGSVSSSVEFSSSRSDSWRQAGRPPPPRRAASWLVARKTSQDSNLSSSRNDSSGSNATASTGTWRTSRSAGSARPRLIRQPALLSEEPPSPPPRQLHTIPSAAEAELELDPSAARATCSSACSLRAVYTTD